MDFLPLSVREGFGVMSSDEVKPQYEVLAGSPRRTRRAVTLVNWADQVLGEGFETYEDRRIKLARRCAVTVLFLARRRVGLQLDVGARVSGHRHHAAGLCVSDSYC